MADNNDKSAPALDVRQDATNRIIDALERGVAPWQKPWKAAALCPVNATSGRRYSGINVLLLSLAGRADPRWVTYRQAQARGWRVCKGERGVGIVKVVELEQPGSDGASADAAAGPQSKRFALKRYVVFNAQQIENMPALPQPEQPAFDRIEGAERVISALIRTGLQVSYGGAQAYYSPRADKIMMPSRGSFLSQLDLYSVLLHEAGHSSGHEKRLGRDLTVSFGSEGYAKEEIVVEWASALLSAQLLAENGEAAPLTQARIDNHAAYVQSWLKILREDKTFIFKACKDAERIVDYLLGLEQSLDPDRERMQLLADYANATLKAAPTKQEPEAALQP